MRVAIAISVLAAGWISLMAQADEPFLPVTLDGRAAYIVPESYATAHKKEIRASIPGLMKIDGFWTPPEQDVRVAERVLREAIHDGIKDPTLLFPNLDPQADAASPDSVESQRRELTLVEDHYPQYIGIILEDKKLIFCNYADVEKADPATNFYYLEKYFEPNGQVHFLQGRVDAQEKICLNLALIGSWAKKESP